MQMCIFCLLLSCFREDMLRYGHAGTRNGQNVEYKCRTELRTLQTQDTSDPVHFSTSLVGSNCPDRLALVPKCPKDSSGPSAELSCPKCRTVLSIQCDQQSAIAAASRRASPATSKQHAHRRHRRRSTEHSAHQQRRAGHTCCLRSVCLSVTRRYSVKT